MPDPELLHQLGAGERGEKEEWLQEPAEQLEPEDGCLWIYDTDDRETLGFTERGIESLKELVLDQKR